MYLLTTLLTTQKPKIIQDDFPFIKREKRGVCRKINFNKKTTLYTR